MAATRTAADPAAEPGPRDGGPPAGRPRRPRRAVLLAIGAALYLAWGLATGLADAAARRDPGTAALLVLLYGTAVACGVTALRRHGPTGNTALLAVAVAGGVAAHALVPFSGLSILFAVMWVAPFRTRLPQAIALAVLTAAGFSTVSLAASLDPAAIFGISSGLGWAMVLAAILDQLATTRAQSAAVARARAREAVLAERQRLAREIHDILAHSLSAQVMHLEGARLLLEQGGDTAQALDRVIRAGDLARAGLAETRRAVEALRGDSATVAEQLDRLAGEFRAATGARCTVAVTGDPLRLSPEARLAVVRTAQEALTNARRHAPGAEVSITLRDHGGHFELHVRDGGSPHAAAQTPATGGYGLIGMRERAELIGGTLTAGPDGPGFSVRLAVPVETAQAAPEPADDHRDPGWPGARPAATAGERGEEDAPRPGRNPHPTVPRGRRRA